MGGVRPWRTRSVLQTVTWLRADASAPGTKCAEPVVASFSRRARTFMTMTARCTSCRLPFHVAPLSSPSTVPTMRVVYHMSCCMSCHVVCVPQREDFRHTDCKDGDEARIVPQWSCGGVSDRSIVCCSSTNALPASLLTGKARVRSCIILQTIESRILSIAFGSRCEATREQPREQPRGQPTDALHYEGTGYGGRTWHRLAVGCFSCDAISCGVSCVERRDWSAQISSDRLYHHGPLVRYDETCLRVAAS